MNSAHEQCLIQVALAGLPPTVNHMYRNGRMVRYKTPKAKAWQEQAALTMRAACRCESSKASVKLCVELRAKNRRLWDLDNRIKALQDAIVHAGVIADDSQICEIAAVRVIGTGEPDCTLVRVAACDF